MTPTDKTQSSLLEWFCVRTQSKHEHIAAARLREAGVEVFLPRIRFKKSSARGPVWVTEALFPNYLFARFNWEKSVRLVRHVSGVSTVVSFGSSVPRVPPEVIGALRRNVGEKELHVLPEEFEPGEEVQLSGGAMHGLNAVITRVLPAKQRVKVLLNFLGQQVTVEVEKAAVVKGSLPRKELL